MTVVVLGWDALDYELLQRYGLADAFGESCARLETIENDALGTPHTYELWPTLITGQTPDEHGIRAATASAGANWSSPTIRALARAGQITVPQSLRSAVGRRLRDAGAELDFKTPDYYRERDIWTVFDERASRSVAIPNYRVDADSTLGVVYDRGAQLADYLNVKKGPRGRTRHEPAVSQPALEERLYGEVGKKLGAVRAALDWDYDLIWVWLGFVDTAGHLEPAAERPIQKRAYRQAAAWTRRLRDALGKDDQLVAVSDHGLRDGRHTHDAIIAGPASRSLPKTVTDVAGYIDTLAPQTDARASSDVGGGGEAAAVRDHLSALGYLDEGAGHAD